MQILERVTSAIRSRMTQCVSSQAKSEDIKKWELYKHLCIAKSEFRLNDRCLTVLNSLLSFLCDDVITSKSKFVVFPSNKQISIRAHMMPESTLRRHLASLIEAGIITRKDSPNCKRYAHKNGAGEVELAYGFDLSPLFARSSEIKNAANRILEEQRVIKRMRDEVSVIRRELAAVFEQHTGTKADGLFTLFREVVDCIPRRASGAKLAAIKTSLEAIQSDLTILLKTMDKDRVVSGNDAQIERQQIESLSESHIDNVKEIFDLKKETTDLDHQKCRLVKDQTLSLGLVLRAFPDIKAYASCRVMSWRDLIDASRVVSSFLGISHDAYINAVRSLGLQGATAAIAFILQKIDDIASPGGYLRSLTLKARVGGFCITQLLFSRVRAQNV
ncbi:plasmid replication protein RepC [Brucella thiophenivorans]|uniref:Replication C N-terminal domain protein n=1 Tax=Brucella thiophenivorans TaxID=571255 RepID=A0A256FBY3_9HYPH|nr:plasmid replication protein RepC [Brucella thiophenivorans]OYR12240.1 replication C N-terminal domain protein [Brucella thiophenivorans]